MRSISFDSILPAGNSTFSFLNTFSTSCVVKSLAASAIGSIAFKLPLAAIDGNVYRLYSRVFGISNIDLGNIWPKATTTIKSRFKLFK